MSNLYVETQVRQALDAVLPDLIRDLAARLTPLDVEAIKAKLAGQQTSSGPAGADRPLTENSEGIFLLPDGSLVRGVLHDIQLGGGAWITTPAGIDFWLELQEIRDVTDRQVEWSLPGGVTATASAENALKQQELGAVHVFRAR